MQYPLFKLMRLRFILLIALLSITSAYGYPKKSDKEPGGDKGANVVYPTPPVSNERLFYVQRTPNANTIVYDLNLNSDGKLNTEQPVKVYWLKYAEKGQKEELNYIQRKFAYGLNTKALNNGGYDIRFVSYKKFPLTLMKGGDGKYHIFALVAQKQVILNRIFVKIEGGSFWIPNVVYVEVKGTDPETGKEIVDRFKP
ncbi:MAG: DUF4833 domain-containing protein [Bacteroidetes bacterium]|jgi:hypothetical protein|nr:DUF4833 domain-containing protein [Bacteroidota bacterium]